MKKIILTGKETKKELLQLIEGNVYFSLSPIVNLNSTKKEIVEAIEKYNIYVEESNKKGEILLESKVSTPLEHKIQEAKKELSKPVVRKPEQTFDVDTICDIIGINSRKRLFLDKTYKKQKFTRREWNDILFKTRII